MPQIFEFHFNPKNKESLTFDSFCYEPANVYEKRMGSLYMVGLLKNTLPQNNRFLSILAEKIKEEYYKAVSILPETSLKNSLKTANDYLEKVAKKGDVTWLGNLSFTVFSLKNFELNFTKIGDLKIILIRDGQIIDIDQKIKFDEFEPYPLKIFGNIVSSKLNENDVILILSQETYNSFLKEKLLTEIAQKPAEKFKNVLNSKKEILSKISGICLLIFLNKEKQLQEKETLIEKKSLTTFCFKEIFLPILKTIKKIKVPKINIPKIKIPLPKINLPKVKTLKINKPKNQEKTEKSKKFTLPVLPKINLFKIKKPVLTKPSENFKKNIILVLILILFFFSGSYLFEKREQKEIEGYQIQIKEIQEEINEADSYLDLIDYNPQARKNANFLYINTWNKISSLEKVSARLPSEIKNQVTDLKASVSEKLEQLNKLIKISDPELIFEFKTREFIPRRIIFQKNNLYFFTPLSNNIFKLKQKEESFEVETIETSQKFNLAVPFNDSILLFTKPNQITSLKENELSEIISLEKPFVDFNFISFNSFNSHLYFLDAENNLILRYPFVSESSWAMPESWLAPEVKITVSFKSMTTDGSVWLLTERNSIQKYSLGRLIETIDLDIFPEPKNFSRIFTSPNHSYIYILEPIEKRVILVDKKGKIIKQFQSEKFDNLLDLAVSQDEKTIYLLNGMKLFKIEI